MTREEFDKLYLDRVIHCDTEEKANHFLALADSVGCVWVSGKSLIERNMWEEYKKETCYLVTDDGFWFSKIASFKRRDDQIIEYILQPKFKVGDKVRVKDTSYPTINGKVGIIEEVNSLSPTPYAVKLGDDIALVGDKQCWLWYLSENDLEKVEEPKFKEGDMVRVKDASSTYTNGRVGIIIEKTNSSNTTRYLVEINDDDYHGIWYYYENELEKVEEPTYKE